MRRWLAVAMMAAGCAILAFVLLQPAVTSRETARAQQRLAAEIPVGPVPSGQGGGEAGAPVARPVDIGEALVGMRVPRFGDDLLDRFGSMFSAHFRNRAERAQAIAAFRDF